MRWWKSSPSRTGRQIAARPHYAVSRERCHNRIPLVNSFPSVVLLGEGRSLNAPGPPRQRHFQRLQLAGAVESFGFVQSGPKPSFAGTLSMANGPALCSPLNGVGLVGSK